MTPQTSRTVGVVLIVVAAVGYLTVADELRHIGEFFAVTGLLVSGVALALAGQFPGIARHVRLTWVAASVGLGMVVGALLDQVVAGVCIGLPFGVLMARLFRRRGASSSNADVT